MKDRIELTDFTVHCVIGVLADEQRRTQPVQVEIALGLDLEPVASSNLELGVNYADVQAQSAFLLQYGSWRLLESVAFAIARLLLAPPAPAEARGQVEEVRIGLRKPTILVDATPGIVIERDALWCDLETRMVPPKLWVDVLIETPRTGAYRVHLEKDVAWAPPPGAAIYVVGGDLWGDGRRVAGGEILARQGVAELVNRGDEAATVLVVTSPTL
jgi:dihydroneopterin aldolase